MLQEGDKDENDGEGDDDEEDPDVSFVADIHFCAIIINLTPLISVG